MRCYLDLHDKPATANGEADEEALMAGLTQEERRKYKLQKKKESKVGGQLRDGAR